MPKLHAKTQAFLSEAETPSVITRTKVLHDIESFDAMLGKLSIQATTLLAAWNAANTRETDAEVRGRMEEVRQTLMAIIRLCAETDKRTTDIVNALDQLKAHTERMASLTEPEG